MKAPSEKYVKDEHARLMSLDVDADRPKLRDVVPYSAKTLASRCRKFLTLSVAEFAPNPISVDKRPTNRDPIFPRWTVCVSEPSSFLSPKWAKHEHWATCTLTHKGTK